MTASVLDQLLEVFPTSRDIANCFPTPSIPRIDVRGYSKSCSKHVSVAGALILSRIVKNPHQSVALFFLLGLSLIFILDSIQSSDFSPGSRAVRGGASMNIMTQYTTHDDSGQMAPNHPPQVKLPTHFNYLNNVNATVYSATPVFWYLPRSGGNTVTEILGKCRGMVVAGAWMGATPDSGLKVVHENGMKQVTADLTTAESRKKARDMGLKDVNSNILIMSPNVFETSDIFGGSFQAELWTWFRHPIERQISYYFYLKNIPMGNPRYNPTMAMLTLGEWVLTPMHTQNPMMTTLLGVPTNPMGWTEMDLTVAKNLLRQKAKIGLLNQKTESVRRFLYGRTVVGASGSRECQERLLDYAWSTKGKYDHVGKKSDAYQLLVQSNSLDLKLYEYALYLFEQQARLFSKELPS